MGTKKATVTKSTKTTKTAAKVAKKPVATKATAKGKAKATPVTAVQPVEPKTAKSEIAHLRGKNPGVTKIIKEMATKKPVTHDEVMSALVKAFPDRRAEGMRITTHALLPSALLRKGFNVVTTKGDDGVKRFQIMTTNG